MRYRQPLLASTIHPKSSSLAIIYISATYPKVMVGPYAHMPLLYCESRVNKVGVTSMKYRCMKYHRMALLGRTTSKLANSSTNTHYLQGHMGLQQLFLQQATCSVAHRMLQSRNNRVYSTAILAPEYIVNMYGSYFYRIAIAYWY